MNVLDNFKRLLFNFHTFGVRRSIDILDKKTSPDPNQLIFGPDPDPKLLQSLQRTSDTKSMKTKKNAFKMI